MQKFGPKWDSEMKSKLQDGQEDPGKDNNEDDLIEEEEQRDFLRSLLQSKELNSVLKMYNVILFANQEQCPCVSNCCQIAAEVMEDVRPYALMIEECRELYAILTTPHIRVNTVEYG